MGKIGLVLRVYSRASASRTTRARRRASTHAVPPGANNTRHAKALGKHRVMRAGCIIQSPAAIEMLEYAYGFLEYRPSEVETSKQSMVSALKHMHTPTTTDQPFASSCLSILTAKTVGAESKNIHTVLLNASSTADGGTMNSRGAGMPLTATRTPHINNRAAFAIVANETCSLTRNANVATVHIEMPAVASDRAYRKRANCESATVGNASAQ